jgi:hypothetical protein
LKGNRNYRILGHILGLKAQQMAEDVIKTLDENFILLEEARKVYVHPHLQRSHSKRHFKKDWRDHSLSEVLRARREGKLFKYR